MQQAATTLQKEIDPSVVDLAVGHPDPNVLPIGMVRDAASAALKRASPELLQYTYEQGDKGFREALAAFLSARYGSSVSSETLFVDTGVSQGLDLFCSYFTSPGDTIVVEDPTYFLSLKIFRDYRLQVVSVPAGREGVDTAVLEKVAAEKRPVFFYTIPVHQNPSGSTQSERTRAEVIELAERYGFTVLADEVYHLLTYEGDVPAPYAARLDSERVVSLGSFSKIAAPGLRLGWFQAPRNMRERVFTAGLFDSGGCLNPFTAAVMRQALEDGTAALHLDYLRRTYDARRKAMDSILTEMAENLLEWERPRGGFFFWLRLKQGSIQELRESAEAQKVKFLPGESFSPSGGCTEYLRLCFAHYPEERLREGVRRLTAAIRELPAG